MPNQLFIFVEDLGIILGRPALDAFEAAFVHKHFATKDCPEKYTIILRIREQNETRNGNIASARMFDTFEEANQALAKVFKTLEEIIQNER